MLTLDDGDLETQLRQAADTFGMTAPECLREAVLRYLMELEEDRLDGEAVRTALDEVAREGTVPWDEVKQELGL